MRFFCFAVSVNALLNLAEKSVGSSSFRAGSRAYQWMQQCFVTVRIVCLSLLWQIGFKCTPAFFFCNKLITNAQRGWGQLWSSGGVSFSQLISCLYWNPDFYASKHNTQFTQPITPSMVFMLVVASTSGDPSGRAVFFYTPFLPFFEYLCRKYLCTTTEVVCGTPVLCSIFHSFTLLDLVVRFTSNTGTFFFELTTLLLLSCSLVFLFV